jgi:hypothetical protein
VREDFVVAIAVSFEAPAALAAPRVVAMVGWAMLWLAFVAAAAILGCAAVARPHGTTAQLTPIL